METHIKNPVRVRGGLGGLLLLLAATGIALWHIRHDDPRPGPKAIVDEELAFSPLPKPAAVSKEYVGSDTCRDCHRDVWNRYQSHPMAHSLSRVGDANSPEDYETRPEFARGKRDYRVERTGTHVLHHERQVDAEGDVIYDQAVEVDYAIGSGKRGRSYVIDRGGILYLSPLSWYSQGKRWDLSPGYPEEGHQRFERRVTDRCIACHAGRAAPDPAWTDRFQQPAIVEFTIGCESCHGPGADHVAWHVAAEQPAGDDPIVNPSRLPAARRDAVCNQCHLQGDAEILRYGRRSFDFRPGMLVGDVWSVLLSKTAGHDGESTKAVSQVQQMLASRCARASQGRLGCISCHDPHFVPKETEKAVFYRQKCLDCHVDSDCAEPLDSLRRSSSNDSCTACHMPRLNAADVPHTTQTDHSIPRQGGRPLHNMPDRGGAGAGEPQIFDAADLPLPELEMARLRGIVMAKMAEEGRNQITAQRAERLLEPVWRAAPDDAQTGDCLAITRFLKHQSAPALDLWRRLLAVPPVSEETLFTLALACQQQGLPEESLKHLERLLEINPWHAQFWNQQRQLLESLGRREHALDSGLKALELDPSLIEIYSPLAQLARTLGRAEQAEQLERTWRRLKTVK